MPGPATTASASARVAALRETLLLGGLVAGGGLLVAVVDPRTSWVYPTCPLLALTGLVCPLCGGLRAVHELAHLDVVGAWAMNPAAVVLAPVVLVAWAVRVRRTWRGTTTPPAEARGGAATGSRPPVGRRLLPALPVLVALLLFGVLRNVPALVPVLGPWTP